MLLPMHKYLPLLLLCLGCNDRPPTTPETRPVEHPNAGNTAMYDVDPDDPYEIDDSSFLDMRAGSQVQAFPEILRLGTLENGEGSFPVYYISGRRDDTLGYVFAPDGMIEQITVYSPDVVTKNGIRVGNTYQELVERIGPVTTHGTEIKSRVYATKDGLTYRLSMLDQNNLIDSVPAGTTITEIILR